MPMVYFLWNDIRSNAAYACAEHVINQLTINRHPLTHFNSSEQQAISVRKHIKNEYGCIYRYDMDVK